MKTELSSPPLQGAGVAEINRLHAESVRLSRESRDALHAALVAAWNAGRLLAREKQLLRQRMGRGAWQLWLEQNFCGSLRTAQRYMLLARSVPDVLVLRAMSLRQVYFRLGIATEPKSARRARALPSLPRHTSLAMRLLGALPNDVVEWSPELRTAYRQDLRPLYLRLHTLFESQTVPALDVSSVSRQSITRIRAGAVCARLSHENRLDFVRKTA